MAKKVYWAFDPHSDVKEIWDKVAATLKVLKNKSEVEIYPIYFLDEQHIHWYGHTTPQSLEPLLGILKDSMVSSLSEIPGLETKEPEVIYSPSATKRGLAQFVANYLDEEDADLIVLSTHARKGVKRAFFGSFAESLLWHCHVPQLMLTPHSKEITKMDKILFPTDTSPDGLQLFERFLDLDYSNESHVDLYSKIIAPSETYAKAMTTALQGGWMTLDTYDEKETAKIEKKLQDWKTIGKEKGVEVDVYADSAEGRLTDRILAVSEELKSDLIVMPMFTSKIDAVLVGSRSLDVVRNSEVPVLIQHFKEG